MGRKRRTPKVTWVILAAVIVIASVAVGYTYSNAYGRPSCHAPISQKPIILYINQGNGIVNSSEYPAMLKFALCQGFNTVFFQVVYQGKLLFSPQLLKSFVQEARSANLTIFFTLYLTSDSQSIPKSILGLGEDGVSLDMSTLSTSVQQSLLATLQANFAGTTAVTTDNFGTTLKPDLLILETYAWPQDQSLVKPGIVASVEALATNSYSQFESEFRYALNNSDGVMVFDYHGMMEDRY